MDGAPGNNTCVPVVGDTVGGIGGSGVKVEFNQYKQNPFAIILNPGNKSLGSVLLKFVLNPSAMFCFNIVLSPFIRVDP